MLELGADARPRAPPGLTADGKQKISLGRGLVRSDVNVILFDEPLTVIDPHLKWQLRSKLKELHQRVGHTMIYVTHDQTEALTFADQVVVMHEGEVVQIGTPVELFERPAHTFVGHFIGSPGMNVLPCEVDERPRRASPASRSRPPTRADGRAGGARSRSASGPSSSASPTHGHAGRRSSRVERRRPPPHRRGRARRRSRINAARRRGRARSPPGPAHLALRPGADAASTPTAGCVG